ncbi:MAG: flagellar motor switch protein FliN [Nevskia sp.]|nr:flagellar motor switch protein FliN [Nevskia sp.]
MSNPNPAGAPPAGAPPQGGGNDYARASFQPLPNDGGKPTGGELNLDVLLDVAVSLSLEVGRARLPIRTLLQLNQGSVVELERAAGEPLDVYANGTLIAHGEVVVVNEKFGVRLIDVVSPAERIRKLR